MVVKLLYSVFIYLERRRCNGSVACDPDEMPMKVQKYDGHGKVDCAVVKSY
jgi:hypothetical protein